MEDTFVKQKLTIIKAQVELIEQHLDKTNVSNLGVQVHKELEDIITPTKPIVKFKLAKDGRLPELAKEDDAGYDCYAHFDRESELKIFNGKYNNEDTSITIFNQGRILIPLGFRVEVPKGYRLSVVPRSGLAIKNGITILNAPGTIDSGYRGDVCAIVINTSFEPVVIKHGERICQCYLEKNYSMEQVIVEELSTSDRGDKGFGSTGLNTKV